MNIAIFCNTPYQLMCAMNYTYHFKEKGCGRADLYLGDNFSGFDKVYERVHKIDLFDNIYAYHPKKRKGSIISNVERFLNIISPKRCLNSFLREPNVYQNKKYDKILTSIASYIAVAMIFTFPEAEVEYYDDGTGSYARELSLCMISRIAITINRLLGRDMNRIVPNKIFLNCPELASNEIRAKVHPLPSLREVSEELRELFRFVWDYQNDGYYKKHRLIALFSTNDTNDSGLDAFQGDACKYLKDISENYLIRLHPRQNSDEYADYSLDERRDMWELVCADQLTEDNVLLAHYSTAQITPKMLHNNEPVLIFAYKAYSAGKLQERIQQVQETVDRLKASYRNKDRVIVPETPEELWECVKKHNAKT